MYVSFFECFQKFVASPHAHLQILGFEPPKPVGGAMEQRKRKHIVCSVSVNSFTNACVRRSPNSGETSISIVAMVTGMRRAIFSVDISFLACTHN